MCENVHNVDLMVTIGDLMVTTNYRAVCIGINLSTECMAVSLQRPLLEKTILKLKALKTCSRPVFSLENRVKKGSHSWKNHIFTIYSNYFFALFSEKSLCPVSYTHLDVYKRQLRASSRGNTRGASVVRFYWA